MNQEIHYQYDGSWEGLLSAIFEAFDRRMPVAALSNTNAAVDLFHTPYYVTTDTKRSKRVEKAMQLKSMLTYQRCFKAFLSEYEEAPYLIYHITQLLFKDPKAAESDYRNSHVLRLKQIEKEIGREVHRIHAFLRFQKGKDGVWYAVIKADFDVIPLIGKHFKDRYADQEWIILDQKRCYGLHYDLKQLRTVSFNKSENVKSAVMSEDLLHQDEIAYQNLWKKYFKSVDIKARENMKLHKQHVPIRYWDTLVEKEQFGK